MLKAGVLALGAVALLFLMALPSPAAGEWNIVGTWLEPENPVPGVDTVVYVELQTPENVSWIRIIQCTLAPYVCFSPYYVQNPTGPVSSAVLREVDPGTPVGWNVTVLYENGTEEQSPMFGNTYSGQETVSPIPEALYFKYVMGGEPSNGEPPDSVPAVELGLAVLTVVTIALFLRWRGRREGET